MNEKKEEKSPAKLPLGTSIGAAGKEMVARLAILSINSVTIGAAKNWKFSWGNPTVKEAVCGSDIKRVLHGAFEGTCQCDMLYVSDDTVAALGANLDTTYTIIGTDYDTAVSPSSKALNCSVKFDNFERNGPPDANGVVRLSVKASMVTRLTGT